MALWGRLKQELDRAGRVAQQALDEGKVRLDLHRARQKADRAAQTLGYAAYRASTTGGELATDQFARLAADIAAAEAEAARIQLQLDQLAAAARGRPADQPPAEPQPPV